MNYKTRIKRLERKYSERNIAEGEELSKDMTRKIKQNYYKKQQKRTIDGILNDVKNKDSIKHEVHDIIDDYGVRELCKNCKEEVIIVCIILYCLKTRNPNRDVSTYHIWNKYEITWQKYSLILARLLQKAREERKIKTNKYYVDNEDFIRW